MRTTIAFLLLACALLAQSSDPRGAAEAGDDLARGFASPPASALPHTWWHWMNGNVSREGITADLEAMRRAGIGGAQIFNVLEGIPAGKAPFMSPQWLDLIEHAAAEAKRLGLELCLHNCAGWSSSGGPWIDPAHAMQIVVTSETRAHGSSRFSAVLPQPETRLGYYQDIAVLAFPTPADDAWRLPEWRAKAGFESDYGIRPSPEQAPTGAHISRAALVDLTARLEEGGHLDWEVPPGEWTILRVGHTPTGKENHPSPDAGRGLECDKLSRAALDVHWQGGIAPILQKLGPLAKSTVDNLLIDSYEVGCNNWTPRFREDFLRLRGYDPIPFLPALGGRVLDSTETTERFLWDFRRTIADLFAENYFGYFGELCRKHGLRVSIEPYDGPFECLAVAAHADIVMGEFWIGGGEPSSCKLASCVAQAHGQQVVGAESFTAGPHEGRWQNHPGSLKALGDLIWCSGVNRFIFHRYAHQPWLDVRPGMTMGQWGTHFDRTNTWWEPSRAWTAYLARAQFLLQQGSRVADACFFGGEGAPSGAVHRPDLSARGYDYGAIGTDLVEKLRVRDGRIELPGGASFSLLVLPDSPFMTPALARKVRELVAAGATVIARRPEGSPSLSDQPRADAEVAAIAAEVWGESDGSVDRAFGRGRVIWGLAPEAVLARMGVPPDFETSTAGARTAFIHRSAGSAEVWFVSNQKALGETLECTFRIQGRQPELWDPESGRSEAAAIWREQGSRTTVPLYLEAAGSVFVVFRAPADREPLAELCHDAAPSPAAPPAPKLEILRARYGLLSLERAGMVDVTEALAGKVALGRLDISVSNALAGDPAPNAPKQLRVLYEQDGRQETKTAPEGARLLLPEGEAAESLRVLRAVYGVLPEHPTVMPEVVFVDVAEPLAARIDRGALAVLAGNDLAGDPLFNVRKELEVDYRLDGVTATARVPEGDQLEIGALRWAADPLAPHLVCAAGGGYTLEAWEAGPYELVGAGGARQLVEVPPLPEPVEIPGPWQLGFPQGGGAPARVSLDTLISWPEHADLGVRYFSGTAVYETSFALPGEFVAAGRGLFLDLGQVHVIAEVALNGRELGVLWKRPYRVEVGAAARAGANELRVRVTNLWPNRLIGDEQHPDDCEWSGPTLARWPEWFLEHRPRPVAERVAFTTWKHWSKDAALLPSGLIGPVRLIPQARVAVAR